MSERLNTGCIAYASVAAANSARGHIAAAARADRSRARLATARAALAAAQQRLRDAQARRG